MYRIAKRFTFDAAHQLDHLPDGHKCARLHGHTYQVELVLAADDVDERGFVVDFGELDVFKHHLAERFDHRHLNEVLDAPPTSEHLARELFEWCGRHLGLGPRVWVAAVRVAETPGTWAEYTAETEKGP